MNFENLPQALVPAVEIGEPGSDITLYKGAIRIKNSESSLEGNGLVWLSWLPTPNLRFRTETEKFGGGLLDFYDNKLSIELVDNAVTLKGLGTSRGNTSLEGIITDEVENSATTDIDTVTFHIPNFIDFTGAPIRDHENNWRTNRVAWTCGKWQILIDAVPNRKDVFDALKVRGGYAITHIGQISKKNSGSIEVVEIKEIAEKLFHYLSFCRGAFSGPMLLVGHDKSRNTVWKDWHVPQINLWRTFERNSWFPVHHAYQVGELFAAYLQLTADPKWDEALRFAISWAVNAQNASTVDMGIVHGQIGIELLSWTKFVEVDSSISKEDFKKLKAADRIQRLLTWANILTDVPSELQNLATEVNKKPRGSNWEKGSTVIAEMRNGVAHPNLRERVTNTSALARYETQELAVWYIELTILRLLNYKGEYHNRWKHKRVGETELVPWSSQLHSS